jgi:hypothetical protein
MIRQDQANVNRGGMISLDQSKFSFPTDPIAFWQQSFFNSSMLEYKKAYYLGDGEEGY